jgi:hypothetical protein
MPRTAFHLCCSVLFHVARWISKGELIMTLVPFADCCLWLGIDPKTFRLWLKAANLCGCVHPTDARLKCLTPSQLQHLADLHGRCLPHPLPGTSEDAASCSLAPASEADLRHQVTRLQAQVTTLSQQVAELALALLRDWGAQGSERTSQKTPLSSLMAQLPSVPQADAAALTPPPPVAVPSEVVAERAPAPSRALALIEYWAEGTYGIISPTQGVLTLVPDSPAWFDWLATLSSFRFLGQQGRLSASRTKGRTSWMAYRRIHGQNYAYGLGQTVHLTIARLEQMAATLQSHAPAR